MKQHLREGFVHNETSREEKQLLSVSERYQDVEFLKCGYRGNKLFYDLRADTQITRFEVKGVNYFSEHHRRFSIILKEVAYFEIDSPEQAAANGGGSGEGDPDNEPNPNPDAANPNPNPNSSNPNPNSGNPNPNPSPNKQQHISPLQHKRQQKKMRLLQN